jgi:hypothetical protein
MKLRGRKPKLTFAEQVKLRSIQAAFGVNSPEVEQFWDAKRASMKATFERKRVYGKQSHEDRRASQRKSSLKYYHEHKDDQTPEAEARRAKHAEHSRNYYHRHKNDPDFIKRNRENTMRWKERHANKQNDTEKCRQSKNTSTTPDNSKARSKSGTTRSTQAK